MVIQEDQGLLSSFSWLASFGLIWVIFWVLIIIAGLVFIGFLVKNNRKHYEYSRSHSALRILKERYARGEIDDDEYRAMKKVLEEE